MTTTVQTRVRNVVGREPKTLEEIARVTTLDVGRVRVAVGRLVAAGRLVSVGGGLVKVRRSR